MTTIAYKDGVMAGDTQVTDSDKLAGKTLKCWEKNGVLFGAAGPITCAQAFRDWVIGGLKGDPPDMGEHAEGFIARGDLILTVTKSGLDTIRADSWAIGSGRLLAFGAMDAGKSAEEAVRIAASRDIYTGGEIVVLKGKR